MQRKNQKAVEWGFSFLACCVVQFSFQMKKTGTWAGAAGAAGAAVGLMPSSSSGSASPQDW
jgi:hypothetical protein